MEKRGKKSIMELSRLLVAKLNYYRGVFLSTHLEPLTLSAGPWTAVKKKKKPSALLDTSFIYIVLLMLILGDYH